MRRFILSLIHPGTRGQAAPDAIHVIVGRPAPDELSRADRPRSVTFSAIRVARIPPSQLREPAAAG